jgi:hypothetical protein
MFEYHICDDNFYVYYLKVIKLSKHIFESMDRQ